MLRGKKLESFIKPGFQTHIHTFDFKLMVPDFFWDCEPLKIKLQCVRFSRKIILIITFSSVHYQLKLRISVSVTSDRVFHVYR